ncbi:MAG TPA: Vps62-related protein [Thermoanaerobaculia bacterium]|nr:Vps62-related protein [Thermoanaerobaculia bacterium]
MLRGYGVFAAFVFAAAGLAHAQTKPSSNLLLPYFEVDLEGGDATTVFAVLNSLQKTVDVTVTVHSNWGLPVLSFPVKLKPREIWSGNLHDWLAQGKLPGRTLGAAELARLQDVLSGQPARNDGLYYSTEIAPGLATGYVVLRTQGDALRGEHFLVNPGRGPAQGDDFVDIDKSNKPAEVCTLHTLRPLAGGIAEARLVIWMDRTGMALPAPVPADREVPVTAAMYSAQGKLLKTLQIGLLPAEQVYLDDLGIGTFSRLEITTGDPSYVAVVSGKGTFSASCSQAAPPVKKPAVRIVTLTNGQDANSPPGPKIAAGDPVAWQYQVTNVGTGALSKVTVKDDLGARVQCPKNALAPGQSMVCSARGTAQACQQKTIGTVTAIAAGKGKKKATVSAQDPSHWYGDQGAAVRLVASVNGMDANDPATGPKVPAGSRLDWTYEVANTGLVRLLGITVTDDGGLAVSCPKVSLGPGEIMVCNAAGTARTGAFHHMGLARASTSCDTVSDDDPAHYSGDDSLGLKLQALVNGYDANDPPGPAIPVDGAMTWEYVVKNVGQYTLSGIAVGDDRNTAVSCPKPLLNPGEAMTCIGRGKAASCQSRSFATATGQTADGKQASASDPTHWFGESPAAIRIESAVNGSDADQPPGPTIPIGALVRWTYTVTNLGNVSLSQVKVTDSQGVTVTCPKTDLQPGLAMICDGTGPAVSGDFRSVATVTAQPPCGSLLTADDPSHYRGAGDPGIRIKTLVNGDDSNVPPGPVVPVGSQVAWSYAVTNTGLLSLSGVSVTDSRGAAVTCPGADLLPGQSMTCTAKGIARSCQFDNLGTATGRTSAGQQVTAVDPGYYLGEHKAGIRIETAVNGKEADTAPGPTLKVGSPVLWAYTVTNTGDTALDGVQVSDDQGALVVCPKQTLQPGETMICTAGGAAVEGQYANTGIVTAAPPCGAQVTAQDPSHYLGGGDGAIGIQTLVDGQDANEPAGPAIQIGKPVQWAWIVVNTGLMSLSDVKVADSRGIPVTCPKNTLQPGEPMTCTGTSAAQACQNDNVGTATARTSSGQQVAAADPGYYFGQVQPGITLELGINGQPADTAPGPTVAVGSPVTWSYTVTNTGNAVLGNVKVGDTGGLAVTCPKASLQPGEQMACYVLGNAPEGQVSGQGSVSADPPCGDPVGATDPVHFTGGGTPGLQLQKLTNSQDVVFPGQPIPLGQPVIWSYVVTNSGQVTLTEIKVSDDDASIVITCPKQELKPGESMTCLSGKGTAKQCQYVNLGSVTAKSPTGPLTVSDPSFYVGQIQPVIQIRTSVNGNDANTAPGPLVAVGSTVNWSYLVTNLGNVTLTNIKVLDDQGKAVNCGANTSLAPGKSFTCTASGTAVEGQYGNLGIVTADPPCGDPVSAQDPSHYFGKAIGIGLRMLTNGKDPGKPGDLQIPQGSPVTWSYIVTNEGSVPLHGIVVGDDRGVTVTCPKGDLPAGESMACTASGVAQGCDYKNTGTATGVALGGGTVSSTDESYYQGTFKVGIDVETLVNGNDADSAPGPTLIQGDTVNWTYLVTNTGDVTLTGVTVTDTDVGVSCPKTVLAAKEAMTCTASGKVAVGQFDNTGTATGQPPCGATVSDQDGSHYFGEGPTLDIEAAVNGQDADVPPGPSIPAGSPVTWAIFVQNGKIALTNVTVTEGLVILVCTKTQLQANESMSCTVPAGVAGCGQQSRSFKARGTIANGTAAEDTDGTHYTGAQAAEIQIDTLVNGSAAGTAPGLFRKMGENVSWSYQVRNAGNVPLTGVGVTSSLNLAVSCPATTLTPGQSITCTSAVVPAAQGHHENRGTASGLSACGAKVEASDSAHYTGPPVLEFKKTTDYDEIWDDQGSGANDNARFYRPLPPSGFHILGHYGQGNYDSPSRGVITVKVKDSAEENPSYPTFVKPKGYQEIWDDSDSGANDNGSVWRPIPPDDVPGNEYVCPGHVFQKGHSNPANSNQHLFADYRCLRKDLAVQVDLDDHIWDDQGSGADDNVNVYRITRLNVIYAFDEYNPSDSEKKAFLPLNCPDPNDLP